MRNLIRKILRESDWEWVKEIPGTKEYGQEYRYFEIITCYGVDWETEECDDEYSHFVKIPKNDVDEIWNIPDVDFDYLAGPGDEGLGVIEYAIENQLIPPREVEEIVMFQGVREIDGEIARLRLGESKDINESDWDWLENTREHANYNGHPQGIVKLYNHDEIDRLCDVIDDYNGLPDTTTRHNLHLGLESRRDELEEMSTEDGVDYGEAMLSVSFFVERKNGPNSLTLGYWPYEVDEWDINEWLSYDYTYNKDYEMYDSIEQVENLFKNYQNPNLMKESDDDGLEWIRDVNPIPEGIKKIIREEMEDDFGWIRDIPAFLPGKDFVDSDVCFNEDDDCEVTIQDDKIVFNIDLDEFINRWGDDMDEYYLKPLIQNVTGGEIYDGDGDYYEFDSDEFNYSGYQVEGQLRRRFTDFIMEVDKDLDSYDVNNFFDDHMLNIEDHLRYPRLYNDFDNLVDEVLTALGYAVQENRWLSISRTFIDRMEEVRKMGVEVEFEYGRRWGHENLIITVPMEVVNQIHRKTQFKDLSGLFDYVIKPITDVYWSDWFYDEWDSSGASDRINEAWRVFLDNAEDYLENEDYQEERKFVDYCYDALKSKGWILRGDGPNRFKKVDPNTRTLMHYLNIDFLSPSPIESRGFINGKTWNSRKNSWRDYNEITTEVQDGDIYETFKKFLDEVESRAGITKV